MQKEKYNGGETSRSRGETCDIIFTEWNLRFI